MEILLHPYLLVLYGIILWQIERSFSSKTKIPFKTHLNNIGRSLIWGGAIVVFDDEITDIIYNIFEVELELEWYFYIAAGFSIDIIREKLTKNK